jgi:hypothetical protein
VVLRLNRGYSAGFEAHVGRNTTFRMLSAKTLKRYLMRTPVPVEDRHVTLLLVSSLGVAKSSLGDAASSLGDAKSSLGDAKSSLGDAKS